MIHQNISGIAGALFTEQFLMFAVCGNQKLNREGLASFAHLLFYNVGLLLGERRFLAGKF